MVWFIITRVFSTMRDLITISCQSTLKKDLGILVLRQQLAPLQRRISTPIRPSRVEKITLAVLTIKLKIITHQTTKQLQRVIRIFQPETVLRWQRELIRLSSADLELAQAFDNRSERLKRVLAKLQKHYDYIVIDNPPSLGLLTINSFVASDKLIIPVSTGFFALTGLVQLQETIDMVKQTQLNPDLDILGVLCTFRDRTNVSNDVENQLREYFGEQVFKTTIPKNVSLEEVHSNHTHIFDYAPNSAGTQSYKAFVKEVISKK